MWRSPRPTPPLNLLYLAFVALIPWTSEILGDYGDESAGVIIYAIGMAAVMLALAAQVRYAFRRGMIRAGARDRHAAYAGVKGLLSPAIFLASIPVALLSPSAATLMWLLLFVAGGRPGDRIARAVRGG